MPVCVLLLQATSENATWALRRWVLQSRCGFLSTLSRDWGFFCIIQPPIPWALATKGNELGSRGQETYKKCGGFCILHLLHIPNHPIWLHSAWIQVKLKLKKKKPKQNKKKPIKSLTITKLVLVTISFNKVFPDLWFFSKQSICFLIPDYSLQIWETLLQLRERIIFRDAGLFLRINEETVAGHFSPAWKRHLQNKPLRQRTGQRSDHSRGQASAWRIPDPHLLCSILISLELLPGPVL